MLLQTNFLTFIFADSIIHPTIYYWFSAKGEANENCSYSFKIVKLFGIHLINYASQAIYWIMLTCQLSANRPIPSRSDNKWSRQTGREIMSWLESWKKNINTCTNSKPYLLSEVGSEIVYIRAISTEIWNWCKYHDQVKYDWSSPRGRLSET